ncbi:MAG: NAD(P)-dependent oxidoreductase [Phycisphaerae bacterium]
MILVTGSAGLLGRELVSQLAEEGPTVRGVDLAEPPGPPCESMRGDLRDAAVCRSACDGVEAIVHAAALQHHSDVPRFGCERFFAANVSMTRTLLDAALAAGVARIVLVSSDMVYGMPAACPLDESHAPRPIGPYGRSKLESERICEAARARGMRVTILRPRLIIGPGRLGVLRRLFDRIRAGAPVPVLGSGVNRYQMVAVSDVAAACRLALRCEAQGVFNLGSSDPPAVRDLLSELIRRAGSRSRLLTMPAAAANAALWTLHAIRMAPLVPEQFRIASVDYVLDTARAARLLGWTPKQNDVEMLWQAFQTYARHA